MQIESSNCDLLLESGEGTSAIEIKSGSTISGDYFTSLDRVADLLPDVVSKTVVYGGTARQERSDCTAVPLADFGSVIDRLDIDQEISGFIRERTGAAPRPSDVEILDAVYHRHVRPSPTRTWRRHPLMSTALLLRSRELFSTGSPSCRRRRARIGEPSRTRGARGGSPSEI